MKTGFVLACLVAGIFALEDPITGPTPAAIDCSNSLCEGKTDGNYQINGKSSYFVQCVSKSAHCQACWPQSLVFNENCNQCVYDLSDPCSTTQSWVPEKRYPCPDLCPNKGSNFKGNIQDPKEARHYIGCWMGITMACVNCPAGLMFNEKANACLYEGKYFTQPL